MDGALYGAPSTRGIVIVAGDSGTAAWAPLAGELTKLGYQVAVLPLPRSDDVTSVRAAAQQLMANGAERVVFIGSRDGAAAALAGAAGGAAGVALLNPGEIAPEVAVPPVSFLALASLADGESSATAQRLYRTAREPRSLALYPAHDPAPTVLAGETGDLKNAFLDFLRAAFQPLSA